MTTTIIVNAVLWVALVSLLLWLLAQPGIAKARQHELRLFRFHRARRASY
ncbi:MAG TPA: hypothetical protein VFW85_07605 [Gaiellaceae bacterium]|nr:hypothetical protein [Gaiellaceae bacterium]